MKTDKEKIKTIATTFFRWWWNQGGTNTEQGFDTWAKTEGKELLQPTTEESNKNSQSYYFQLCNPEG